MTSTGRVATALTLVIVVVGCTTTDVSDTTPPPTARCDAPEFPPLQFGSHLIGDAEPPVPYSSTPPTSGWHISGGFEIAVQPSDQPLREPVQVGIQEAGAVVVTYRGLDDADRLRLERSVQDAYPGRVAVTPYEALEPGEVVLAGYGVLQRCRGVDLEALEAFVTAYAEEGPQPHGADAVRE